MYVCLCHAVTDSDIESAVDGGLSDLQQLEEHFGVGSGCGSCREMAEHLINRRIEESQYYAA
jgi:bacterioferritin-associated ferredoxin